MQESPYLSRLTWPNLGSKWTLGSVVLREARGSAAVVTLALHIGRRIAREELEGLDAAKMSLPDEYSPLVPK